MKVIKIIREADVGETFPAPTTYGKRVAARAVVFDKDGKVALLYATKKNYHTLPGGGVEAGEDIPTALIRELQEEIGCAVENIQELGIIEEYRNKFALHQISHCFVADLSGSKEESHFDAGEIADGFSPIWMSLDNAVSMLENESAVEYKWKFILLRDLIFLKEAYKIRHK